MCSGVVMAQPTAWATSVHIMSAYTTSRLATDSAVTLLAANAAREVGREVGMAQASHAEYW